MIKTTIFQLYNSSDIQNALSNLGIYDMNQVKRIEITKVNDYDNSCLLTVFLK